MRQDGFCSMRGVCVNGTLDDSSDETESLLLVAAIEENNGSMIRCLRLASEMDISTPEESDIVILEIFGKFVMLMYKICSHMFPLYLQIVLSHLLIWYFYL